MSSIRTKGYATYDRVRETANPGKTSAISVPVQADKLLEGTVTLAFFAHTMTLPKAIDLYLESLNQTAATIGKELARFRAAA